MAALPSKGLWARLKASLRNLSSRTLLAAGLSSIVVCALFVADMAGLVPDRVQAQREGRVTLAESVALTAALLAARGDADSLSAYLATVATRNSMVAGVRLRSADGGFVAEAGALPTDAQRLASDTSSSDTRVVIPVMAGQGAAWGHVELVYQPLSLLATWLPWLPPIAPLATTLALLCTVVFHLYLKRMLRHLDPSNAIPARVRTAFDTLAEGLLVLDPKGHIVLANQAIAGVLGVAADGLIGRKAAALPWGQDNPNGSVNDLPWVGAQADGQLRYGTALTLTDSLGKLRSFKVNSSPISSGASAPSGVLVSLDDVTELQEKELQLRVARDAAQDANRAKSDFLANMSHEIRTPMNAILGFTDLLRRGQGQADPNVAHKYLNIIHGSGKHLLDLINDILDLSKVEAGRLDVESVPCAVHQVVLDVARIMAVKAEEKGIALRVCFDGPLPATTHSDPSRLRQVFTNLVGNAIKFTATGEVRISLRAQTATGLMHIDVADSGIGIAADRLESIFEPFVQAEASTTRQFGGTGLGLTISRRFARALGGDVRASSQPGRGSVFHVSFSMGAHSAELLSVAQLQALQAQDAQNHNDSHSASSLVWRFPARTVLVVDDGVENRELVRVVLEEAGLTVIEAENGAVALQQVQDHAPALVLMDIQMPVMDGSTATRTLRQRGHTLPVLALTANAMKGFEHDIASNGFTSHLTKPIDIDLMLATLAPHLQGQQVERGRVGTAKPLLSTGLATEASHAAASASAATSRITSRLAQHPRLARVARSFCEQLPGKLVQMQSDLAHADWAALAALAHWLKGAGGSVGYDVFFEPSKALEDGAHAADAERCTSALQTLVDLGQRIVAPPESAVPPAAPHATPTPELSTHQPQNKPQIAATA